MRIATLIALTLLHGIAAAQSAKVPAMNYNFAELRYVDVNRNGGDGFRLAGSYRFQGNWLVVGAVSRIDFNNDVDSTTVELGAGYVWPYRPDWDFLANLRIVRSDVYFPLGSADDTGGNRLY